MNFETEKTKNPDLNETDIQALKEWADKQAHLPKIPDLDLIIFLHSNYYRVEPTKSTIDIYYTARSHLPEFFSNRDPVGCKEVRQAMQTAMILPLKEPTKEGYKVIYAKLIDTEPSHFVYTDIMRNWNMVMDLWLHLEGTQPGHVVAFDCKDVVLGHVGRLSPMAMKKFLYYLQEAMPVRLKSMHFMNASSVMDIIFGMMKPFMKKELLNIFHMHTNMDSLQQFVPLEAFPNEVGGKAGPMKELYDEEIKKLENQREWFKEEEKTARVDESLRPGKPKSASDLFGVEGSFKKLEID